MAKDDKKIDELREELKKLLAQAKKLFNDFDRKMTALEKKRLVFLSQKSSESDQKKIDKILDILKK